MNKWMILAAAVLLGACASINKNTVNYQMSRYDQSRFYVVAGEGATKDAASSQALANMRVDIISNVADVKSVSILPDLMANAKVEKVWRDKSSNVKNYFALAVLDRDTAKKIVTLPIDKLDAKLAGLAAQFAASPDKFADLKVAFKMQPLVNQRNILSDLYQFLDAGEEGYKADEFARYKNILRDKMAAIRVAVKVKGVESVTMMSLVVDALNKMGLGVVPADAEDIAIMVNINTDVDGYESEKVKGLEWCSSSASVSMTDQATGATFARFNVHDRAGTSRAADSLRRSMQGVGEKASEQITRRMDAYLKTR